MEINKLAAAPQLNEEQEAEAATQKLDKNIDGAMAITDTAEKNLKLEGKTESELWELIRGQFETVDTRGSLDALRQDVEANLSN